MEKMTNPASGPAGAAGPDRALAATQAPAPRPSAAGAAPAAPRAAYSPPVLERLGAWRALTLQQSVPIFP